MQQRGEPKMKANEFVKKFGWGVATKLSKGMRGITESVADGVAGWGQSEWDKLKRLVESYELVEKDFDSVEIAEYEYMISGCYSDPYWIRIKQEIADVESCYD